MRPSHRVSVQDRLAPDNRPSGFDYLRIILALLILVYHSISTCLGPPAQLMLFSGFGRPLITCMVPMFFALSGFLVATSLERSRNVFTFVGLRVIRLFPALAVDTLFCALFLGTALTSLTWSEYFGSSELHKYFLNMIGDVHYLLPGVFHDNPSRAVNEQLWTIPFELQCYVILAVMAVVGLHRRRGLFALAAGLFTAATAAYVHFHPVAPIDVWHLVVPSFLIGVCIYLYREKIAWSPWLMAVALLAMIVLLYQKTSLMTVAAIPIAYVTVWLGLLRPPRDPLIRSGDYSYPIYLYSYPIQQAIVALFVGGRIWWINLLIAVPVTFTFAAVSWHLIEKPAQTGGTICLPSTA